MVPPRERCDVCFARTTRLVEVKDTGTLQAFSVVHLEFVGQTRTPPYVYAEIVLDGNPTRLIHNLGGFAIEEAKNLTIGMSVRAVWKDASQAQGTLSDIECFSLLCDPMRVKRPTLAPGLDVEDHGKSLETC